ncbi:hypothetical protein D039_3721A, partial [Vibrio parahaemolyticus EKP-028]
MLPQLI